MGNKRIFIFVVFAFLAVLFSTCKKAETSTPKNTFFKEFGDWSPGPSIESIFQMPDGGFLLAGSGGKTGFVPVFIRTTKSGGLLWKKQIDNDTFPAYFYLKKNDGTFIINGYSPPYNNYISKLDTFGNVLAYNKVYHYRRYIYFNSFGAVETPDGNNLISMSDGWDQGAPSDNYIEKYDNNLNLMDSVNLRDYPNLPGKTLLFNAYNAMPSGVYYAWGVRFPRYPWNWGTNSYPYVALVHANGAWKLTEIDTTDRGGSYIGEWPIINKDSSLAILSQRYDNISNTNSAAVSCVDKNLKVSWHHFYPEIGASIGVWEISACSDGGYIIAGQATVGSNSAQPYALRIDRNGNKLWSRIFNFSGSVTFNIAIQTNDEGFAFAGYTSSFGAGKSSQVIFIKTDKNGNF